MAVAPIIRPDFRARAGAAPLKLRVEEPPLDIIGDFRARAGAAPLKPHIGGNLRVTADISAPARARPR